MAEKTIEKLQMKFYNQLLNNITGNYPTELLFGIKSLQDKVKTDFIKLTQIKRSYKLQGLLLRIKPLFFIKPIDTHYINGFHYRVGVVCVNTVL